MSNAVGRPGGRPAMGGPELLVPDVDSIRCAVHPNHLQGDAYSLALTDARTGRHYLIALDHVGAEYISTLLATGLHSLRIAAEADQVRAAQRDGDSR